MNTYCILDGARMLKKLDQAKSLNQDSISLYSGLPLEILETISPYIFFMEEGGSLTYWLKDEGWGKSWGIYIRTEANGEQLFHHFQKFIKVVTDQGKEMYFRFYDPRALRIFLPTCKPDQLNELFGPVSAFVLEDKDPEFALEYTLKNGKLVTNRFPKMEWFDLLLPAYLSEDDETEDTKEYEKNESSNRH